MNIYFVFISFCLLVGHLKKHLCFVFVVYHRNLLFSEFVVYYFNTRNETLRMSIPLIYKSQLVTGLFYNSPT